MLWWPRRWQYLVDVIASQILCHKRNTTHNCKAANYNTLSTIPVLLGEGVWIFFIVLRIYTCNLLGTRQSQHGPSQWYGWTTTDALTGRVAIAAPPLGARFRVKRARKGPDFSVWGKIWGKLVCRAVSVKQTSRCAALWPELPRGS